MRLITLKPRNFKGIRDFTLEAHGANVTVYGDNATGKTSLADAFMWLLFDKDSANRKDFEIKTLDADGQAIHGLEHEVAAVLDLEPGRIELRKVYQEQWTKKRGSAKAEFTGHTTDHYIDGVPVQRAEYAARIARAADERTFRLLTDPAYYNEQLHWQERRRVLLEVCGDVSDADVIASDPALAELPGILGRRSLDDHRKVLTARRTEINRELERVPVRIDEVQRGLPEITGDAADQEAALTAGLATLRRQRQDKDAERARIQSGGQMAELRRRRAEIETQILEAQRAARAEVDEALRQQRVRLQGITGQADVQRHAIAGWQRQIAEGVTETGRLQARMDALRADWHAVDQQQLDLHQDENCPACGQALPEERLQAARDKALSEHNLAKSRKLQEITAEGRRLKERADEFRRSGEQTRAAIAQAQESAAALDTQTAEVQARIDRMGSEVPDVDKNPEYARLSRELDAVTAEIEQLQAGSAGALQRVAAEIQDLDSQIARAESAIGRFAQHRQGLARIEELKGEERKLATEFEELERQLYLCEQFTRAKVRLLTDRINSRFELARFRLFEVQVNGALAECCETLYEGVPYSTALNRGARINVGLDIIRTLSRHYGFQPPVWLDNREAVTRLIPMDAQVISLVVSERDKALRVETESAPLRREAV